MSRYIDAEALELRVTEFEKLICQQLDIVHDFVSSEPSVDVRENVHGKWILFDSKAAGYIQYCSCCKIANPHRDKFCPNCGADMADMGR